MKILIASTVFAPSLGGMETMAELLMRGLIAQGHDVTVVTCAKANIRDEGAAVIVRNPSIYQTVRCILLSEAVILLGLTLRLGWPLLFLRRRTLVTHLIDPPKDANPLIRWIRGKLAVRAKHIACSQPIASILDRDCVVVGNPYDDEMFTVYPGIERSGDLVFVGRLVPEKGVDVLLGALAILSRKGIAPKLAIVGNGPLRSELEMTSRRLGVAGQVEFLGPVVNQPLATLLNQNRILVVPSSWNEPFGIVALLGIACGCAVIGSAGGGLPEAIGPCGLTYPNHDRQQLAVTIESLLRDPAKIEALCSRAPEHLPRHSVASVVHKYLECLSVS
jgi:glycogen(starch) synthase